MLQRMPTLLCFFACPVERAETLGEMLLQSADKRKQLKELGVLNYIFGLLELEPEQQFKLILPAIVKSAQASSGSSQQAKSSATTQHPACAASQSDSSHFTLPAYYGRNSFDGRGNFAAQGDQRLGSIHTPHGHPSSSSPEQTNVSLSALYPSAHQAPQQQPASQQAAAQQPSRVSMKLPLGLLQSQRAPADHMPKYKGNQVQLAEVDSPVDSFRDENKPLSSTRQTAQAQEQQAEAGGGLSAATESACDTEEESEQSDRDEGSVLHATGSDSEVALQLWRVMCKQHVNQHVSYEARHKLLVQCGEHAKVLMV